MAKKINFLVIFIGALLITSQSYSQPQRIIWDDLKQIQESEEYSPNIGWYPKTEKYHYPESYLFVSVQSPRGQAESFRNEAKHDYVKLDSSNFYPELFNRLRIEIYNIRVRFGEPKIKELTVINRIIMLFGDEIIEPDSIQFDKKEFQNGYGAVTTNIDATAYFPLKYFDGSQAVTFVIFYGDSDKFGDKYKRVMSIEEIMKME